MVRQINVQAPSILVGHFLTSVSHLITNRAKLTHWTLWGCSFRCSLVPRPNFSSVPCGFIEKLAPYLSLENWTYRIWQKFRQEKIFTNFASERQWQKFFRRIFSPTVNFDTLNFLFAYNYFNTCARTRVLTAVSNSLSLSTVKMSIFKYFSTAPRDLPNPTGPLSCELSSPAIAAANAAATN